MRIIIMDDGGDRWDDITDLPDKAIIDLGEARSLLGRMVADSISRWADMARSKRLMEGQRSAAAEEILTEATAKEGDQDVPY